MMTMMMMMMMMKMLQVGDGCDTATMRANE